MLFYCRTIVIVYIDIQRVNGILIHCFGQLIHLIHLKRDGDGHHLARRASARRIVRLAAGQHPPKEGEGSQGSVYRKLSLHIKPPFLLS